MEISVGGTILTFSDESRVHVDGYDLYVAEPEFDQSSEQLLHNFISKRLGLPPIIDCMVSRTGLDPVTKVYADTSGRKRLWAYFD